MILGNDIAGPKLTVTPILILQPCMDECTDRLQTEHPGIFPACVTTGPQSKQDEDVKNGERDSSLMEGLESNICEAVLEDTFIAELFSNMESGSQSSARLKFGV